jgi:hypothetical protein
VLPWLVTLSTQPWPFPENKNETIDSSINIKCGRWVSHWFLNAILDYELLIHLMLYNIETSLRRIWRWTLRKLHWGEFWSNYLISNIAKIKTFSHIFQKAKIYLRQIKITQHEIQIQIIIYHLIAPYLTIFPNVVSFSLKGVVCWKLQIRHFK